VRSRKEGIMKTILNTLFAAALSIGGFFSLADAAPGDTNGESRVEILNTGGQCTIRGGMCVTPGAPSTVFAPSSPAAALGSHAAAGHPPRLARTLLTAARSHLGDVNDDVPWTLDLRANLRHAALAGNAVFLIYDADNARALANREVIGAWQAVVPAGDTLAARLTLSPNDGFHAGKTYRVRVVQLVHGKEIVLTDGPVRLL
jgi:hypothetical protein